MLVLRVAPAPEPEYPKRRRSAVQPRDPAALRLARAVPEIGSQPAAPRQAPQRLQRGPPLAEQVASAAQAAYAVRPYRPASRASRPFLAGPPGSRWIGARHVDELPVLQGENLDRAYVAA